MTPMRKAFEAHFHERDEVQRYVELALAIVEDVVVPEDLREAAFTKVLDLLAAKQVTFEAVAPSGVLLNQRPQG